MSSPAHTSFKSHIDRLDPIFIVDRPDGAYTDEDHAKALAYTLLASAWIEEHVETIAIACAEAGIARYKTGQVTAAGRALMVWHVARKLHDPVPIHDDDVLQFIPHADGALLSFRSTVKGSHGISEDDLRKLTYPLGLRAHDYPTLLGVNLETLSSRRNPASHSYVNRAKSMRQPKDERDLVARIVNDLELVDIALSEAVSAYPRK